jgi:hypothetical protein
VTSENESRDGRCSPRIVASIPPDILPLPEASGAVTAVINLHSALILSPVPWPSGTALEIRSHKTNRSIRARVVWTGPKEGSGSYKLGVELKTRNLDFGALITVILSGPAGGTPNRV